MKKIAEISCLVAIFTLVCGCSKPDVISFRSDGYVSINRIAPQIATPETLLGFLPALENNSGDWLQIDTKSKKLILFEGTKKLQEAAIEGDISLKPGRYEIKHKQRSPLWYAGDDYFEARGLSVPEVGHRERYRRGALGDFALFIDSDTPIHSSPEYNKEVGGIRIDDEQMRKIYYSLDVGSVIEIR